LQIFIIFVIILLMDKSYQIVQNPAPGKHVVKFCGDTAVFSLSLSHPKNGTAWVRTNIGQAKTIRREIIREVEHQETPLGKAWFDIPMKRMDDLLFQITLPLCEVGHFEAKCFFLKENEVIPIWPPGPNTVINVDLADACCANIIYNAFVRQFGPNKKVTAALSAADEQYVRFLDNLGYSVIPPSGTFRDLIKELDFIIGELGCRILMLLPIHPTPTTYGPMGRFGSPYAALSFTNVDPALAEFDPHATPLEQFIELIDAVHQRNAKIMIDIAINHTGWAASLHETHPQWLVRGPQGKIEVPGAWGVRWEDLTKLDYSHHDLWQYMANVFLTWCNRGVDGFRCDAGYMIPVSAWKYMIAKVRDQYPNTVFLLEGLGGKISVTRELLNSANLNWAYSELFQNYDRGQIEHYLPEAIEISNDEGLTVHFAETHDNPRLAARSTVYAHMRTALCALTSPMGAFGFANGVEWYATEKINVHDSPSLNWGAAINQVEHITRLNQLLKAHPAFHKDTDLIMVQQNGGNHICLLRHHKPSDKKLLVLANLDDKNQTSACWNRARSKVSGPNFIDLLTDNAITVSESEGLCRYLLDPGQVLCLTEDELDLELIQKSNAARYKLPRQAQVQRLQAKAFEVLSYYRGIGDLGDVDPEQAARSLSKDPLNFCKNLNPISQEPRVVTWRWPRDLKREVMLPPEHFLMIHAECPFRACVLNGNQTLACEESLKNDGGSYFALVAPSHRPQRAQSYTLKLSVYSPEGWKHKQAPLLVLPRPDQINIKTILNRPELVKEHFVFLDTNGRGGMVRIPVSWGMLTSRYDGLLAANLSSEFPEDRWIMFARCRAWLVFQGYSQELNTNCLEAFGLDAESGGYWRYHIPSGQGEHVLLTLGLKMTDEENAVQLTFYRHRAESSGNRLDDQKPVQLILRPDIENRSFHETTKAYMGPEYHWHHKITQSKKGFYFSPDTDHHLQIQLSDGNFIWEPEWHYMVHRAIDAERGLDPDSDLFSPGYFSVDLKGNQQATLFASISKTPKIKTLTSRSINPQPNGPFESDTEIDHRPVDLLNRSLNAFVARRGELKTVIAGYPWFLDWGRDSLIFVRGLIANQKLKNARAVINLFGQFEEHGTLPNMIRGNNAGNRDTSDAPLWFVLACKELIRAENNDDFLNTDCGGRTIRQILLSVGQNYIAGTPNGIRMDPQSGLIFSPDHFTWMDTNHPAGTPRRGYPVEIQALWYTALRFFETVDTNENHLNWRLLSQRVQASIQKLFWQENLGCLSDCLHAISGQPASDAIPDDALRPNQLLAITLGVVSDGSVCRKILEACEELLVPGAIRSLADRPVRHPIEIIHRETIINDPHQPYYGNYRGDEDTQRKPAYHNGTAWTWLFPAYCEAWALTYGEESKETALAWLTSGAYLLEKGCLGHIPEVMDGDFPHNPRGCDAQAWGASELLRVWCQLISKR
jgi:predicted glycogen debranching enzyme